MDRGAWQATVHVVARVGYDLATKSSNHYLQQEELGSKMNKDSPIQENPSLIIFHNAHSVLWEYIYY